MSSLEDAMNRVSDLDAGWWPFLSQRPPKEVPIDDARLFGITVRFGPLYGALVTAMAMAIGAFEASLPMAAIGIAWFSVLFYLSYKFSFAVFWNRRARRLQAQADPAGVAPPRIIKAAAGSRKPKGSQ